MHGEGIFIAKSNERNSQGCYVSHFPSKVSLEIAVNGKTIQFQA
jgi:hypothetical protein